MKNVSHFDKWYEGSMEGTILSFLMNREIDRYMNREKMADTERMEFGSCLIFLKKK